MMKVCGKWKVFSVEPTSGLNKNGEEVQNSEHLKFYAVKRTVLQVVERYDNALTYRNAEIGDYEFDTEIGDYEFDTETYDVYSREKWAKEECDKLNAAAEQETEQEANE